uniref:DUF4220 domain-containing protein n=1 Tax=Leersia perrieri TaxID=77586 RepID=A0A0D9WEX6_9ORYZ
MEKPSELVKWFFLFQKTDKAMLMRIEFLVVAVAILFLSMSFLDMFRPRSRNSAIKGILLILDAICDAILIYTIGLMQTAPFKNDLFPVWALVLVISAYGIPDQENRRISEAARVVALLGVAYLNSTFNTQFRHLIWALWALQQLRIFYISWAYFRATRSFLHGWSSPLLTAYMGTFDGINARLDPTTMEGYKYLVSGEQKQKIKLKPPEYNFSLYVPKRTKRMLVTLDKAWQPSNQQNSGNNPGNEAAVADNSTTDICTPQMKDMCLSFALYRLLRCRFDDLSLPGNSVTSTRKLISEIIGKNSRDLSAEINHYSKRSFRIVRYPVLFWRGFPLIAAWYPVVTIALFLWLGRNLHKIYKPKKGETAHVIHGVNVDIIITWLFMIIIVLKEIWKIMAYMLSDWTKVMVLCEYTAGSLKYLPRWLCKAIVWFFCTPRSTIVHHWHKKIDQYEFLQSFKYNPWKSNTMHYVTLGLVEKRSDGEKPSNAINLPEEVKPAILRSLIKLDLNQDFLEDKMPSLEANFQSLLSFFKFPTCSHILLVWHIATSLCEIELAQHYNTCLNNSEVLRAVKAAMNCCSSQPYIVKEERIEGELRANYIVASCISRYCGYLLISEPDLLPDTYLTSTEIFVSTVAEASEVLKGSDNLQSIYRKLMRHGDAVNDDNMIRRHPNMILKKSAQLAMSLIKIDDMDRWKVLADVWVDMLVHIAPSWNAAAHRKCLSTGGEFITQIWAILSHCNIQYSKLWPQQKSPQDKAGEQEACEGVNRASVEQQAAEGNGGLMSEMATRHNVAGTSGTKKDGQVESGSPWIWQEDQQTQDAAGLQFGGETNRVESQLFLAGQNQTQYGGSCESQEEEAAAAAAAAAAAEEEEEEEEEEEA